MTDSNLKVTLIQPDLHWEDIEANLRSFEEKIKSASESDLIVLPEMFTTGFTMNASGLAEEMNGRSMTWMRRMAQAKQAVVCGSMIIHENGRYYNRLIWMRSDGTFEHYDKRHLFSLAKEHKTYTPGQRKLIVKLGEWSICPQICYDLRFPVWARNVEEYDVLINVANWPESRRLAWTTLTRARAIENQCYVVAVSRVGRDGNEVKHFGGSVVVGPLGEVIWEQLEAEAVHTVTLSKQLLYETRRKLPFLKDRDTFEIR